MSKSWMPICNLLIDLFIWVSCTFYSGQPIWAYMPLDNNQDDHLTNHNVQFHKFKRSTFQNIQFTSQKYTAMMDTVFSVCYEFFTSFIKMKMSAIKKPTHYISIWQWLNLFKQIISEVTVQRAMGYKMKFMTMTTLPLAFRSLCGLICRP